MTTSDLGTRRIGLVLSGGGAKGAYHLGVLKALRARGLDRFVAIAGSSVGAINAVCAGAGRLDEAEAAWRRLRARDVVGLTMRSVWRLPGWSIAALASEFSPFKITRLSDRNGRGAAFHAAVCAILAAAIWFGRALFPVPFVKWIEILAAVPLVLALLALTQRFTRAIFLRPVATTVAPLAGMLDQLISDADVERLREAGVPIYGVLSQHAPQAQGAHRWGGWAPRYLRIDQVADATTLRRLLVNGSAVPGFLEAGTLDGRTVLDGAWTDNVPAAPLLFGEHDLDVILVVYLKRVVRHTNRSNSLCALAELLVRDAFTALRPRTDLASWAKARWTAYGSSGSLSPDVPADGPVDQRPAPRVLAVAPSRRVGNFFTGTLWFSPAKSASLIDMGERDMHALLDALDAREATRIPLDIPAAGRRPVPASPSRRTRRALWPSGYQPEAE